MKKNECVKLVALTLTRIDGDVIEEFLRYTARFVDHHYVAIMGAADATREVVDALIVEGLPITVWRLSDSASVEADVTMTAPLARMIFDQRECDYILPIDADEFIVADDREHLHATLEALPTGAHAAAYWTTYIPSPEDDASEARVLARIRHRRKSETHPFAKVFINRSFASDAKATIIAGNHMIDGARVETIALSDVRLAHFPVRSVLQIQAKALVGNSAFLASGHGKQSELGYQWQLAFERLFRGREDADPGDLRDLAAKYLGGTQSDASASEFLVYDPLPSVARVYGTGAPDLLDISIGLTLQIARAYGNLRNTIMPPPLHPDRQWPAYDVAVGGLDTARVVDADGVGSAPGIVSMVAGADSQLELRGWVATTPSPISSVCAVFPGKKFSLDMNDCEATDRKQFSGTIGLDDFEDGMYVIRIFTVNGDGHWFALPQTPVFEKRAAVKVPA